jgi:hypothetical protein
MNPVAMAAAAAAAIPAPPPVERLREVGAARAPKSNQAVHFRVWRGAAFSSAVAAAACGRGEATTSSNIAKVTCQACLAVHASLPRSAA